VWRCGVFVVTVSSSKVPLALVSVWVVVETAGTRFENIKTSRETLAADQEMITIINVAA
jgi:hypothetical protein